MSVDIEPIIAFYVNLLIIQYHNKPKAQATIAALIRQVLAHGIFFDIRDGYAVETAVGIQLDVVGKYVGVDRFYQGQDFGSGFFALLPYAQPSPFDTQLGLLPYAEWIQGSGSVLTYDDVLSTTIALDDGSYRTLIEFKIIQNNGNNSHKQIDDSLYEFFGSAVRASSSGNMQMVYFVPYSLSQVMAAAIQKHVLPKPMGVGLNYYIPQRAPFFSCCTYENDQNIYNTGFTDYADFDNMRGETLDYSNLLS